MNWFNSTSSEAMLRCTKILNQQVNFLAEQLLASMQQIKQLQSGLVAQENENEGLVV